LSYQDVRNQIFDVPTAGTTGYQALRTNAGQMTTLSHELSVNASVIDHANYGLDLGVNFTKITNKVKKLADGVESIMLGGFVEPQVRAQAGYTYPNIYGKAFKRTEDGQLLLNANGLPQGTAASVNLGECTPDFNMGWRNSVSWKGLNLSFLINARFGGIVTSATQAVLDQFGVSQATADARDRGYVEVAGGVKVDPQKYYEVVANQQLMGYYYYSATNVRLQNISLSYTLPRTLLGQGWPSVTVGFIANNLWMIYNKAPFDPEIASSTGTYGQGSDYFSAPSLRNLGFSLKLNF